MSLAPRAAAIRGDDYQHAIGWYWVCEMLVEPQITSVAIEDPLGGAFDDIVVRRADGHDTYIQAKSSNFGDKVVDQQWLFSVRSEKGRSPLQHFYDTYVGRVQDGKDFTLEVWTNRGFDHRNKLLGELLEQKSETIATDRMLRASRRSAVGRERDAWAKHLGIENERLAAFLEQICWKQTGSEGDLRRQAKPLMQLAGLRSDDQAVEIGVSIVRHWVTDGVGPQTADDVRATVAARDLLAMTGTLVLAVHGIDHDPTPTAPNMELDFVELYDGDDSFSRKLLNKQTDWNGIVVPAIEAAAKRLSSYRVRRVHVTGSMRHPMWFAVGRALPEVKRWALSVDQVDATWTTTDSPESPIPRRLTDLPMTAGTDIAVGIGLTGDPTAYIDRYLGTTGLGVGRLVVFGPEGEPSPTAVPSGAWAMGWTRAVRNEVRDAAVSNGANKIHLFTLCPAGVALMLGHQWNVMPPTVLYEYAAGTYHPTLTSTGG